ncbi:MAG TPA: hypothetical protein VGM56_21385 [Byssovorax sp.]|jgi:hypothetical protein
MPRSPALAVVPTSSSRAVADVLRAEARTLLALADALERGGTSDARSGLVSHVALARELGLTRKAAAHVARAAGGKRVGASILVERARLAELVADEGAAAPAGPASRPRRARRSAIDDDLDELGFGPGVNP